MLDTITLEESFKLFIHKTGTITGDNGFWDTKLGKKRAKFLNQQS